MIELIKQLKGKQPKRIAKEVIYQRKLIDNSLREHPLPEHAVPQPKPISDKDANNLTRSIVDFINAVGGLASRVNNMGVYRNGMYTKSNMRKGFPDIQGVYSGKCIYIEVKYGKDKLSQDQKDFLNDAYKCGAKCHVAKSFDEFFSWFCLEVLEI